MLEFSSNKTLKWPASVERAFPHFGGVMWLKIFDALQADVLWTTRQLLSYKATLDEQLFGAKLEAWRHKMSYIFHVLQCEMVLGNVNPL